MRKFSRQLVPEGVHDPDLSAQLNIIRVQQASRNRKYSLITLVFHQPAKAKGAG
jgi:hypothetical protein